jgi:hypothetical protein
MDEKNKFSDGYASGLKRAVNLKTRKLTRLKSHDFHILMERIIPVMFRGYMPDAMWQAIAELSYFYRQICAKEISKNMMEKLEKEIPVLLCKLEKIFPPGFFNLMVSGTIIRGTLKTPNSQLVTPISIKLQRPDGCD